MYTEVSYEEDCYIMFGKESAGIPEDILAHNKDRCVRIPMLSDIRSLNLSNSVAVVLYEALRQNKFFSDAADGTSDKNLTIILSNVPGWTFYVEK